MPEHSNNLIPLANLWYQYLIKMRIRAILLKFFGYWETVKPTKVLLDVLFSRCKQHLLHSDESIGWLLFISLPRTRHFTCNSDEWKLEVTCYSVNEKMFVELPHELGCLLSNVKFAGDLSEVAILQDDEQKFKSVSSCVSLR